MVFKKTPSHLWESRTGLWHFKLGIPASLQRHFPGDKPGKVRTHIVESLGTHNRAEALRLKVPILGKWQAEFRRLAGQSVMPSPKTGRVLVSQVRAALAEVAVQLREAGTDDEIDNLMSVEMVLHDQADDALARVRKEEGPRAEASALRRLQSPEVPTLLEGLGALQRDAAVTAQYRQAYALAVHELLAFLEAADALPQEVTDSKADAYVDMLNQGPLSLAVKKKRISTLRRLWASMKRKGWRDNPWQEHALTDRKRQPAASHGDQGSEDSEDVRPFTDAEAVRVLALPAPADSRQRTYTRALFRELYVLGFTTGMRLNELVSLRPADIKADEGWRVVTVRKGTTKNDASVRTIPVCHPVAVAILDRRRDAQADPVGLIFSECVRGGPDRKPSWHVSKAMSRERLDPKRLGFGSEVNFHSTRRSFVTLMENSEVTDTVGQQRYIGHSIPTVMHKTYSGGSGLKKLRGIVQGLRYADEVEEALRLALSAQA